MNTIITNKKIDAAKLARAQKIMLELYHELPKYIARGHGPFLAAIYDENGNLIAKTANSVMHDKCSHNHAEMNAIRMAEIALNTHDLSAYNLSLYSTAEPCMMCLGGIMWSGVRNVYFGVPSAIVEKITKFDEGFKPNWMDEFKKRGITVCGNIDADAGAKILQDYMQQRHVIYKPEQH